jgi:GT2 family glycosyltransferase
MSPRVSQLVTISIASKDRPEVLDATLRKIHAFGLGDCPLIVCDDGSEAVLDPPALRLFPNGRLLRNETPLGQALARNRIANECQTPYLLQLDDDSYPVAGNLKDLCDIAGCTSDWLAIALPFQEPARGRGFPVGIPEDDLLPVRAFVGCSVLIHVQRFRELGGYAAWIGRTVEEEELCLRSYAAGLRILTMDMFRVQHDVSDVGRGTTMIAYRSFRNWTLVWLLYAPALWLPVRMVRLFAGACCKALAQRNPAALIGLFSAFSNFRRIGAKRTPLAVVGYRQFQRAPHALDFFP